MKLFTTLLLISILSISQVTFAISADTDTDAAFWLSLSRSERSNYVLGFKNGAGQSLLKSTEFWTGAGYFKRKPSRADLDRLNASVYPKANLATIVEVITKLYEDPSNAYVGLGDAIYIAFDKLKGIGVEHQLREARRVGFEFHQNDAIQK